MPKEKEVHNGVVKFFTEVKGYGFIKSEGKEYFVHASGCIDKIQEGDTVLFDLADSKKREGQKMCIDVKIHR